MSQTRKTRIMHFMCTFPKIAQRVIGGIHIENVYFKCIASICRKAHSEQILL